MAQLAHECVSHLEPSERWHVVPGGVPLPNEEGVVHGRPEAGGLGAHKRVHSQDQPEARGPVIRIQSMYVL